MKPYWIEGLFVTRQGLKKARKRGKTSEADIELFAKSLWANSPEEALQLATEALDGGEWVERPKVSQASEEQRMRAAGAPELPGFGTRMGAGLTKKKHRA
jgi:hypothetical protein